MILGESVGRAMIELSCIKKLVQFSFLSVVAPDKQLILTRPLRGKV